jgi:F-type H+-transporting ATPase subunit b
MLIDWFTVGAQALNFVVLVWLMKRFLYKPVLDAIDAREKRIATELAHADRNMAAAQSDRDDLQHKNEAFDQQRAALLAKSTAEADAERRKLLDRAREAADALTAARQQTMASDAKNLSQALRQRTQAEVFGVARQALKDLASTGLEASVCELFIVRLRALEGSAKDELAAALKSAMDGALVRTAFELPAAQRAAVDQAVNDTFAVRVALHYEVAADLVGGIELSTHGQKFSWNIADYLSSLERDVDDLLKPAAPAAKAPVPPAPKPESKSRSAPQRSPA